MRSIFKNTSSANSRKPSWSNFCRRCLANIHCVPPHSPSINPTRVHAGGKPRNPTPHCDLLLKKKAKPHSNRTSERHAGPVVRPLLRCTPRSLLFFGIPPAHTPSANARVQPEISERAGENHAEQPETESQKKIARTPSLRRDEKKEKKPSNKKTGPLYYPERNIFRRGEASPGENHEPGTFITRRESSHGSR